MLKLFYSTYISVDHAHHEIFRAKVGKGGIINGTLNEKMFQEQSSGLPQALEIMENLENHPKKFHVWKNYGI